MRRLNMLIVMTAMVFLVAGSAKGNTSPGPLGLNSAAVTASGQLSLHVMKGAKSLGKTILLPAQESTVAQFLVTASAQDGKDDDDKEKDHRPRSVHCPPDKDDHHNLGYRANDQNGGDNQGNDDKDKDKNKDHHDDCGKGDDGKNP